MRSAQAPTAAVPASGVLVTGAAVWGLPPLVAAPVGATLLVLLALLVLRRLAAGLTGMAVLVVLVGSVRYQVHPDAVAAVTTSALLVLLILTSLPLTVGLRLRAPTVLALAAASGCLVMLALTLASSVTAAGPVVYLVGLGCTLAAYWLAVPHRHPARQRDPGARAGGDR